MTDDIETEDSLQLFYQDLLNFTRTVYSHDKAPSGDSTPTKKFLKYVKSAPNYGLQQTINLFYDQLKEVYKTNSKDILEGYDNWIFNKPPLMLKVNNKIYLAVGTIYSKLKEEDQNNVHASLCRLLTHMVEDEKEKSIINALATTNEKKETGGVSGLISSIFSDDLGGNLAGLVSEIGDKLKQTASNPNDVNSIDATKIGSVVKDLLTDNSTNSFVGRLQNNPALKNFAKGFTKEMGNK